MGRISQVLEMLRKSKVNARHKKVSEIKKTITGLSGDIGSFSSVNAKRKKSKQNRTSKSMGTI